MSRSQERGFAIALGIAGVLVAICTPAVADPPARVGRLSEVSGVVSSHAGDEDHWSPATLNDPATSGDAFWTEPNSRAEIHVGSTALNMDASTELDIATLDDHQFVASLPQGTINIRIVHLRNGDSYAIATPRGTVVLDRSGTYDIAAGTDQDPTNVAVLEGEARITGAGGGTLSLTNGEAAVISGKEKISYEIEEARATPFDDAVLARERRDEAPRPALRYVSPEMTGAEDLDDHGSWREEAAYGPVWYPQAVAPDWAPYRDGHWRWVDPWGWTWIDDEPWGFAPFHYGRWAYIDGRWGWVPGTIVVRPVYAPALVTFIGGAGWQASLSLGQEPAVGWFPLAPREVYVPAYPASVTYIRNVNVTNVRNVTNITNVTVHNAGITNVRYANRDFATVIPQRAFVAAHPVAKAALSVPHQAISAAPVSRSAPIAPDASARTGHPVAAPQTPRGRPQTAVTPGPAGDKPAAGQADARQDAAPGPAIRHDIRPPGEARRTPAQERAQTRETPREAVAPGPPIAPTAKLAPAERHPTPPSAPGRPIVRGPSEPSAPHVVQNQPSAAPPPHRPAPPPSHWPPPPAPERNVPHPVQQTVLQPTRQGWVRSPAPPREQGAPHPAAQQPAPQPPQHPAQPQPPQKAGGHPGQPEHKKEEGHGGG